MRAPFHIGAVRAIVFASANPAAAIPIYSECGQEATGLAEGWEAHLVDLDDDGQDEIVFFCPVCAEREFHGVEQSQ